MIFTPLEKAVWVYTEMLVAVLKLPSEIRISTDRERAKATLTSTSILELKLDLEVWN